MPEKETKQKFLAVAHSSIAPLPAVPATKTEAAVVWQKHGLLNHSFFYDMQSSSYSSLLSCHSGHTTPVACAPMFSSYTWGIVSAAVAPLHDCTSELDYSLPVLAHHHHCRHYRHFLFICLRSILQHRATRRFPTFFQRCSQATAVTKSIV